MDRPTHDPRLGPLTPTDPGACTCAHLRQAMRAVTQVFDAALRPIGLTATQFTVLAVLSKHGSLPLGRLAAELVADRTTLTRTLRPLEDRSLVRIAAGRDRRVRAVTVTNRGRFILGEALPLWQSVQAHMVGGLGAERWAGLLGDLDAAVALARTPSPGPSEEN